MGKLVVANWKMNPGFREDAIQLARGVDVAGAVICPPSVFLVPVGDCLTKAQLGAQDVFWGEEGAYTGEVSAGQLKSAGCKYVIVGHSERRGLGETDEIVGKKVAAALDDGLTPILCVGEPRKVRDQGARAARAYVQDQLEEDLEGVEGGGDLIIAYEPIWAISTSKSGEDETPEGAVEMIMSIRKFLKAKSYKLKAILYGGSVNGENAEGFFCRRSRLMGCWLAGRV